jgi:oligoendopeptidase F
VTVLALPSSPGSLSKARWDDIGPYFDDLAERPLDKTTVEGWLQAWSTLEELVTEAAALAMIAYTIETSNPEREADHLRFSTEIMPKMEERSVELARRLVESGYRTPALETVLSRFRTSIEIFREANVPIFSELEELGARYQRITGSMTVEWEGQERPLPQLQPYLRSADRAVRERAFRAAAGPYLDKRDELARLFDRMYELRQRAARNAGFPNFRDYIFPAQFRFDYTPADCERFPRCDRSSRCAGRGAHAGGAPPPALARRASALGSGRRSLSQGSAPAFRHHRGVRGSGPGGIRTGRPGPGRRISKHDRRAVARS